MKEAVYTVDEYHDGPLAGFADFDGTLHHYRREFDYDADAYSDIFSLTPIADEVLPLVQERWELWLRWRTAFRAQETTIETRPALPADRRRYEELDGLIWQGLTANESRAVRARGNFHATEARVEWTRLCDGETGPARSNEPPE